MTPSSTSTRPLRRADLSWPTTRWPREGELEGSAAQGRALNVRGAEAGIALLLTAGTNSPVASTEQALIEAAARLVAPAAADWCAVYGPSADGATRRPTLRFTYPHAQADLEAAVPLASEIAQARLGVKRAFEMGTSQQTMDAVFFADDEWTAPIREVARSMRPHALLAVPLTVGSTQWGVLLAARTRDRGSFGDEDLRIATAVADATAIALARVGA
jgi:GAF domain-containing protein